MKDNGMNETKTKNQLNRRNFLKCTAAVAAGVMSAGLITGCSKKADVLKNPPEPIKLDGWLGQAPEIADSQIKQTMEADVVIVGAGVAGLHAARAASEAGASVIVVEKAKIYQVRSGQYGVIDSKVQKSFGIKIDKNTVILENMKQMGYRADQRMWKYWADHSGEAFDWLLELAPDLAVLPEDALSYVDNKLNLLMMHFPAPAGYNQAEENSPTWPTVMSFVPNQNMIMERVYQKCLDQGCKFLFSTKGEKLIRPDNQGRVQGVICQDVKGTYGKILARKAVILATGDYGNNKEMMTYFVPWAADCMNVFPNRDAKGKPTNTGDGHKMGAWIGGKIEDGPHAPMVHTLGGPLGVDAFFLTNIEGKRFVNEDLGGQQLSCALYRQPENFGWQIFDDKWPEQLEQMGVSHGAVNHCVAADKNPKLKDAQWSLGRTAYTSREDLLKTEGLVIADSITELIGKLGLDAKAQETLLQSIKRYNQLCYKGVDEDFGKTSKRLFPIETAPFYAGQMRAGALLVNMGGLTCDPETGNVLDKKYKRIEGLYAIGNVSGGRFLGDYPVVTAGTSHGFALTYGRLVGSLVAKL
ncbi:FAD-dependent oxidoreductase [Sporomusa acidovorans]|uniref:Fumarate reductase flavoprotein subunit n=1 Tax=Sporomusa acidovorans (strain ATCC 49682 / DSM 3132 / Mol) TaxID=1123286 RepID=A0ABZ3J1L3_SPOA4|nr:FAD-dependent oxidoreductase [Sporomusa acidovorans]OZC23183.1 fumarate reductase flavoprotein subunit precursor [Sporomusa acidovorans DSM 3132]SDE96996.1 FAD binding domain-containing protein [Sporomusa acidovorans]